MSDKKIIAVMGATGAQGGGLARAILADKDGPFAARAVTRNPASDKAHALAAAGAEVVSGDADDPSSLERAFAGAHGAFLVTNFWEHMSPEREVNQAAAMARATKAAGVAHAVWSTLEDTRLAFPLDDARLKTLRGKYKVPHFDAKGEADAVFAAEAADELSAGGVLLGELHLLRPGPTQGRRRATRPGAPARRRQAARHRRGRHRQVCVRGLQTRPSASGQRFGIAGEVLSGPEYAAAFSRHLGAPVTFYDMPFDDYRALGFPGADDMGNMFEHHAILGEAFRRDRSPEVARSLNPALQSFDSWLSANAARIPIG